LDQYDQNLSHNQYFHQHRHSVDHAITLKNQQPPSYDCVDASSSNFSAFKNHPYNVPNNRFPLPYQISNSNIGMYGNGMICKGQQQPTHQPITDQFYDPMSYRAPPPPQNYQHPYYQQPVPQMINEEQYPYYQQPIHHHHHPPVPQQAKQQSEATIYSEIIPPPELINFSDNPKSPHLRSSGAEEVKLKSSLRAPKQEYLLYNNCDGQNKSNSGQTTPTTNTNSDSVNVKSQDGIGSYDTWNFVFKNLEKQGYREGAAMESPDELINDFNEMHLSNSSGKKSKNSSLAKNMSKQLPQTPIAQKSTERHTNGNAKNSSSVQSKNPVQKSNVKVNGSGHRNESANGTKTTKKKSIEQNKSPDLEADAFWNCRFCTFLNPETIRICQMCAKSKDFFLDSDNGTTVV
jgi:hypothetical protein